MLASGAAAKTQEAPPTLATTCEHAVEKTTCEHKDDMYACSLICNE